MGYNNTREFPNLARALGVGQGQHYLWRRILLCKIRLFKSVEKKASPSEGAAEGGPARLNFALRNFGG